MPMEAFKENDTGGRILGGGAIGGEWTGRGPVVAASYSSVTGGGAASQLDCGVSQHER